MKAPTTTDVRRVLAASLVLVAVGAARGDERTAFDGAARVVEAHCLKCHSGPRPEARLDLSPRHLYRSTVNVPARTEHGALLVDPGRPEQSLLYRKLLEPEQGRYRGPRMPMHAAQLAPEELAAIREWIQSFPAETWGEDATVARAEAVAPPTFHDEYLANLPTSETLGRDGLEVRILHRFKTSTSEAGSHGLYGLDGGAWISLGVDIALGDSVDAGLRRTNLEQDWEASLKWRVLRQRPEGPSISVALRGLAAHVTAQGAANAWRGGVQLIASRRFGDHFSAMLVPSWVSRTNFVDPQDERSTAALGVGAEWRFNTWLAATGEWIGWQHGVSAPYEAGTLGVSIATARHVFHLLLSNAPAAQTDLVVPGGDLDWSKHQVRLGFNISRTFDRAAFRRRPAETHQ